MHASSMNNMTDFVNEYLRGKSNLRVLDIGSRNLNGCYKGLFDGHSYTGFDIIPGRNVDISDWDDVAANSFDVVISGQAFEHIKDDLDVMKKIERALKPGGICCIIAPSSGPWHCRPDYRRYQTKDFYTLAHKAGLIIVQLRIDYASKSEFNDCILIVRKKEDI